MTEDEKDTRLLATLITQTLSGGALTGTDDIPATVLFTAGLIKGQGWKRCNCPEGHGVGHGN